MSAASPTCGGTGDILPSERANCSFNVDSLKMMMGMGQNPDAVAEFRKLFSGPVFDNTEFKDYRSYEERFVDTIARAAEAVQVIRDPKNRKFMMNHMGGGVRMEQMFDTGSMGIHFTMFLTFIKTNASKEQQAMWLEGAQEARYFGAYAQTELGHGSNVRGLETTATFDKETDEFVVHSPYLTSLKWWPTGMYACTHGVVFAQLIIDGKNYGMHGFMVQFRDDQGNLMPGVEVGEMGPKINADNTNIGYARFTHLRIPRFNMFAKYQQVTKDGEYIAPPRSLSKFRYISMMQIRMMIVGWSFKDLSKAATIAIRYSCVRKQGFKDTTAEISAGGTAEENRVLDYQVQQYRTFKALAISYCFYWNAIYVAAYLGRIQATIASGTEQERDAAAEEMPELHATLSGLKVWSTMWAHEGIEDCRKACGGQGYLRSSGVCDLSPNFAEPATVEGEQVIMSLQVARFLMKSVDDQQAGKKLYGSVEYLNDQPLKKITMKNWKGQTETLLALMKDRANRVAKRLSAKFKAASASGLPFDKALNSVALIGYKAAECHSAYIFTRNNYSSINEMVPDENIKAVLIKLLDLVMLTSIREHAGDWAGSGCLDDEQLDLIDQRINEVLGEIRPDAVSLTDCFGYPDHSLHSTLGRFDGNVYEAIYEQAKASPLNKTPKMVGWEHLEKIMDKDFLREGMKTQRVGEIAPSKL